jgi:hypothetical protein
MAGELGTTIRLRIKPTAAGSAETAFDVDVEPSATVTQLKEVVEAKGGVPAAQQRLIFKVDTPGRAP